jgi:hypothetical protein
LSLIPKGLYVKMLEITYNPFGIRENIFKFSYKHTIPSGLEKIFLNFPINIHSLREYEGERHKVDLFLQTHKMEAMETYSIMIEFLLKDKKGTPQYKRLKEAQKVILNGGIVP